MNYIKAINAFYDHQEFNPLTSAAINPWHSLMHVNNKSRWKEEFTAPMSVLCLKSSISESSIRKARKELVEKGYITFTSRPGNQAPIYHIIPLYEEMETTSRTTTVAATRTAIKAASRTHYLNKTKRKKKKK